MELSVLGIRRPCNTEEQCLGYLFDMRFPRVTCEKCGRSNSYHKHPKKSCYTCNCGRSQIFPKRGTIFERSSLPLRQWFKAMYIICTADEDVSAKHLERELKVSYPTAWRMKNKINGIMDRKDKNYSCEELLKRCIKRS